jgi:predicted Zn-ribbon and HTH transcriptional regulator
MGKVTLEGYVCDRCGHKWIPRSKIDEAPTICPKCKSPYWNKPRKLQEAKKQEIDFKEKRKIR